jgi:serine/threonine protein kinase
MVDVGGAPIDRYVVLEHLSEGGMGAIYVGKKLGAGGFEMEVVLKQLLPEFTQQEEFIDLFLREAKLSATLDHANIVHTIDLVTADGNALSWSACRAATCAKAKRRDNGSRQRRRSTSTAARRWPTRVSATRGQPAAAGVSPSNIGVAPARSS